MIDQEIIDLYIEKRAFQETIHQFTRNCDVRMETNINYLLCGIEDKIKEIDFKLNQDPVKTADIILRYKESISNYELQFVANGLIRDSLKD